MSSPTLLQRVQDEADLCRNEGATDIAALLDEVAVALAQPAAAPTQADLCAQIAKNLGSGWIVIGPDGSAFQADTPHRAANEASKHRSRMLFDHAKAAEFENLISDVRRRNEESNACLEALFGTLNCPTCGGSGHVEDAIARMGREAQPAPAVPLTDEQIKSMKPVCADFVSFRAGVRAVEYMLAAAPEEKK